MSDQAQGPASGPLPLPDKPDLEWLKKQAKRRLAELRGANASARLADAQLDLARRYGFPSWRALKTRVDSLGVIGRMFDAVKAGDLAGLVALLDADRDALQARKPPYNWTLLHAAAQAGQPAIVNELLARGLDVNAHEDGDNTVPLHWAAAAGHVEVVKRLIAAGSDVIGHGDDHALEIIGWATCWDGCDDDAHREVVRLLLAAGARHHIYSAMSMGLADEVRRIVAADPAALRQPLSHNEDFQLPLHFAVRRNLAAMVSLLIELGADPLGTDASGYPPAAYAISGNADRQLMEALRARGAADLFTCLALGDWDAAERALAADPGVLARPDARGGALHLMAKRGDVEAVRWLLDHGADPSRRWAHWNSEVTPLHLAILGNHPDVVRVLLDAGANPRIEDTFHHSDALGWAEFFRRQDVVAMLEARS